MWLSEVFSKELNVRTFFLANNNVYPHSKSFSQVVGKQLPITISVQYLKRSQKTIVHYTPGLSLFQAKLIPTTFLRFYIIHILILVFRLLTI